MDMSGCPLVKQCPVRALPPAWPEDDDDDDGDPVEPTPTPPLVEAQC